VTPAARAGGGATHDDQADALEAALAPDDRALLDRVADELARRRLAAAALFFLESLAPLGFVGSQAMHFLRPLVGALVADAGPWDRLARLLERRGAVELLVRRLEARA
jgi:hypothetical protein